MDRIITMIINQVVRRFVTIGINKGFNHFATKGKTSAHLSESDHVQSETGHETAKRARQTAKLTRRLGR